MDTNRIRYFLSLARTGSISKAAELHHISPAAFSKAMKVFESEVGRALTIPDGRGLRLTDSAREMISPLEEIIRRIESVRDGNVRSNEPAQKRLKIATFEVFSTYFMTKVLKTHFRDFSCELYETTPGLMEEAVANGTADLALTYLPIPHPALDFLKITDIEMGIFGHADLVKNADISEVAFAAPVSPVEGSPNKVRGLDGWPDDAFPRAIRYRVTMLETALGLCREGLAVAYLPTFVADLHNEIVKPSFKLKALAKPAKFPKTKDAVYLVKRKSDYEGVEAKRMALAIRQICR